MSLFQRYVRHRAPGATQDDAIAQRYLPLDAGRMAILANNAQHLAEQNPRRALRQRLTRKVRIACDAPRCF